MPHAFEPAETRTRSAERRVCARQIVRSLTYIELGEGNGGIVLNISEGGVAVQAVMSIPTDHLPHMRVQLAHSGEPIEARGRIAWTVDLGKRAGIEFVGLDPEAHARLQEWVSMEACPPQDYHQEADSQEATELSGAAMPAAEIPVPGPEVPPSLSPESSAAADRASARFRRKLVEETPPDIAQSIRAGGTVPTRPRRPYVRVPSSANYAELNPAEVPRRSVPPRKPTEASNIRSRGALVGSIVIVAALSVAWAAGYGPFRGKSGEIENQTRAGSNDDAPHSARPETTRARISEIEIVDAKNQRWTIPFSGPPTPPETTRSHTSVMSPPAAGAKGRVDYPLAPLTSPVRPSPETASEPPPLVATAPVVPDNMPPSGILDSRGPTTAPSPPVQTSEPRAESVAYGELLVRVEPVYPPSAIANKVEGTVMLRAAVDRYGAVTAVEPVSGPSALISAALAAVRQWRYAPTLINGQPVQAEKQITIVFRLTAPR